MSDKPAKGKDAKGAEKKPAGDAAAKKEGGDKKEGGGKKKGKGK